MFSRSMLSRRILPTSRFSARRPGEGFTLIELLIVIAIIVLLASWIIGNLIHARRRAENVRCNAAMTILATALDRYHETYGMYPKIDAGLDVARRNTLLLRELLITKEFEERGSIKRRTPPSLNDIQDIQPYLGDSDGDWDPTQPFLDSQDKLVDGVEILDPWGQPFVFKVPGEKHTDFNEPTLMPHNAHDNTTRYDLWSIGRNGVSEPDGNNLEETDDWTNWFEKPQNAD